MAEQEQREAARCREEAEGERRATDSLKAQLEQTKAAAAQAYAEQAEEIAAARRAHDESQARAAAESARLSALLLEQQRETQAARAKWEAALQALQQTVNLAFQDTLTKEHA